MRYAVKDENGTKALTEYVDSASILVGASTGESYLAISREFYQNGYVERLFDFGMFLRIEYIK